MYDIVGVQVDETERNMVELYIVRQRMPNTKTFNLQFGIYRIQDVRGYNPWHSHSSGTASG